MCSSQILSEYVLLDFNFKSFLKTVVYYYNLNHFQSATYVFDTVFNTLKFVVDTKSFKKLVNARLCVYHCRVVFSVSFFLMFDSVGMLMCTYIVIP